MKQSVFSCQFKVRDSECDLSGIVNHANYLNYLEHTRHEFLTSLGIDFPKLAAEGKHLVVTNLEIKYRRSLRPQEDFIVYLKCKKASKVKFLFEQEIQVLPSKEISIEASVYGVALNLKGRPTAIPELQDLFIDQT